MAKISLCQTSTKFNILGYRASVVVGTRWISSTPHRLVFQSNHEPVPRLANGGIDIGHVTAITTIEVIDDH